MKATLHTCLFVLFALLTACGTGNPSSSDQAAVPQQVAPITGISVLTNGDAGSAHPASATPTCPTQAFDTFLVAFANDVEIQKASVEQPLYSEYVDALADPEPKPVTKMLGFDELHFPLMPNLQKQADDGLHLETTDSGNGERVVKLVKPDTDYQLVFTFKNNDGCWRLYRMRDDSL